MKRCRVCRKKLDDLMIAHGDPYCSSNCCKTDHGISLAMTVSTSGSGQHSGK